MKYRIYHGSADRIEVPQFGVGSTKNDYGLGFYCTESQDLAKEWAVRKGQNGWANSYEIESEGLKVLRLSSPQYTTLHWLTILLQNRQFQIAEGMPRFAYDFLTLNYSIPYRDFDIIIGYRADDSYFRFAKDFVSGTISYQKLSQAIRLGGLGEQFVLISEAAFERIRFIGSEPVLALEWAEKAVHRDKAARQAYSDVRLFSEDVYNLFIGDIIRNGIKPDDSRLR